MRHHPARLARLYRHDIRASLGVYQVSNVGCRVADSGLLAAWVGVGLCLFDIRSAVSCYCDLYGCCGLEGGY